MRRLASKILGEVNDLNGLERTSLHTDTTTDAQSFGYESNFAVFTDFNAQLTSPDNRTGLSTFLHTFLGLASVFGDYSDSKSLLIDWFFLLLDHVVQSKRSENFTAES